MPGIEEATARKMLIDMGLPPEVAEQAQIIGGGGPALDDSVGSETLLHNQMDDREMRAALHRTLVEANEFTPVMADEILDLAFHARNRAFGVMQDICNTASGGAVQINAVLMALQLIMIGSENARDNMVVDINEQTGLVPSATAI